MFNKINNNCSFFFIFSIFLLFTLIGCGVKEKATLVEELPLPETVFSQLDTAPAAGLEEIIEDLTIPDPEITVPEKC